MYGYLAELIQEKAKLPHGELKDNSGIEAHTLTVSFNFILGLIIACLWCLSFVR